MPQMNPSLLHSLSNLGELSGKEAPPQMQYVLLQHETGALDLGTRLVQWAGELHCRQ